MLFGSNRVIFLDFLRNLSPQIMLFTIALVLGTKLDFTHFLWTLQGFKNCFAFTATLLVFIGALTANVTLFVERAATSSRTMNRVEKLVHERYKGRRLARARALLWATCKYNRSSLLQGVTAVLVVEIGLTSICFSAISAVISVLRTLSMAVA